MRKLEAVKIEASNEQEKLKNDVAYGGRRLQGVEQKIKDELGKIEKITKNK